MEHINIQCKIKKISRPDLPGGLRTQEVEGVAYELPNVGKTFMMIGDPINKEMDMRMVETSPIESMSIVDSGKNRVYTVNTRSGSVYEITLKDFIPDAV